MMLLHGIWTRDSTGNYTFPLKCTSILTSERRVKFERLWSSVVCSGKTTGFPHVIFWFCGAMLAMLYLVRCPFGEHSQRGLTTLNEALHAPGPSWGTMTRLCVAFFNLCVAKHTVSHSQVSGNAAFVVVRRSRPYSGASQTAHQRIT